MNIWHSRFRSGVVEANSEEINLDDDSDDDVPQEQDVPAAVFGGGLMGAMDRLKKAKTAE